jgi:ribonuclease-3
LFKRYPYKGEGFLTEMRSKMVNRQQLNDIAVKMGLKKLPFIIKLTIVYAIAKYLAIL